MGSDDVTPDKIWHRHAWGWWCVEVGDTYRIGDDEEDLQSGGDE
jgi:hypothetical protein